LRLRNLAALTAVGAVVVGGGSATAASLITSQQIKDGTVANRDIAERTISQDRLTPTLQQKIESHGQHGQHGQHGPPGITRTAGHWGIIDRNVIGAATADLRSGPFVPGTPVGEPPHGNGSLNILIADAASKLAYGNEIDFAGDLVADLTDVGFHVYSTGENADRNVGGANMPNIIFEIDKNGGTFTPATDYSSLVFNPAANSTRDAWSGYIDATDAAAGDWGLTRSAGTDTGCSLSAGLCSFDEIQAALDDGATIRSVSVSKGRDYAWQGAIDGLTINDTVFDFEEHGVFAIAP
jgi:hypothetical protein